MELLSTFSKNLFELVDSQGLVDECKTTPNSRERRRFEEPSYASSHHTI